VEEADAKAVGALIQQQVFDVIVFDHTLRMDERLRLIELAKVSVPAIRIVVLHRSAELPGKVDLAMDSREGPAAILNRVNELLFPRPGE